MWACQASFLRHGFGSRSHLPARGEFLRAMREATEERAAEAARWVSRIRSRCRRYLALRRGFDDPLGPR